MSESREILRAFFRKWSATDLTPRTRKILTEDLMHMRIMLEIYGEDTTVLDGCESAHSREWFGKRHHEVSNE